MLLIKKEAEKASGWTGEEGVLNLTALGDGHDDAGGCAAAGQRGEAELRGEAAGGGHGGMAAAARSSFLQKFLYVSRKTLSIKRWNFKSS